MKKKIRILFSGLSYLNHNYGAQGIAFPIIKKLNMYFDLEAVFAVSNKHYFEDKKLGEKYNYKVVLNKFKYEYMSEADFFDKILTMKYLLNNKLNNQKEQLISEIIKCDAIIDLSGIEFIGNRDFIKKWSNYLDIIYLQEISKKYNKLYLKYTKSYGPFSSSFYSNRVRKHLKELPALFIRGKENLKQVEELDFQFLRTIVLLL